MLPDYKESVFVPLKHRHVHIITLQATFSSGVATVDAAVSSPGVTLVAAGSGVYNMTFPKGQYAHAFPANVDPPAGALAAGGAAVLGIVRALSASAGTCTVTFTDGAGTAENPTDLSRAYVTLLLGRA